MAIAVPELGSQITTEQIEWIFEAFKQRRENFPNEPEIMTFALVMLNIGDRFTPVTCVAGEWEGHKQDLARGTGVPNCPNGHVLMQGLGMRLGWIQE